MDNHKYIHYFTSKSSKYIILSTTTRPVGKQVAVKNKATANKIAKERNLIAWNF